jgi:predicted nucleic acid-binding protein
LILADSNIVMYAAGAEHPFKRRSTRFLESVAEGRIDAAIDAEALEEILHRYRALRRWSEGRQVYDMARTIFPTVIPVTAEILDRARALLDVHSQVMARDALHAAVVECHSLDAICSFDRDFDRIRGIRRIEP